MEHVLLIELDAGLVERVHAQHIGGDAARQLEEVEQLAERIGIDLVGLQHDVRYAAVDVGAERALEGLLLDKVERLALEVVQAVQILPVDLDGRAFARRGKADDGLEEVALALLDHLAEGVQVGREFHGRGEQALTVLALAFAEQLLPPAREVAEARLIAAQQLDGLAAAVQQVADGGILPRGVFKRADVQLLAGAGRAEHNVHRGDARNGHRQQADGGQHAVAAADIRRDDEGLVALLRGHLAQRAVLRIRRDVDALLGLLGAVLALEHPAQGAGGDGRLRCGAGL